METQASSLILNQTNPSDLGLKISSPIHPTLTRSAKNWFFFGIVFILSNLIAVALLITNQNWNSNYPKSIEVGCHGPEMGFALLAGLFQWIYLKHVNTKSN